ncbi:hypothetical protein NUW58_g1407 [Xylaria curta]|uniref:Uncharacterized protein n=1 Tax=Xylaria curta TaxID=42375 RepID=A0ACC1PLX4_9PEZI|nr:hypothetical protein NUW58_g1407 [Xylaria curta]
MWGRPRIRDSVIRGKKRIAGGTGELHILVSSFNVPLQKIWQYVADNPHIKCAHPTKKMTNAALNSSQLFQITELALTPTTAWNSIKWHLHLGWVNMEFNMLRTTILLGIHAVLQLSQGAVALPSPPEPEPIEITELPLPPVAPSSAEGSCTADINPLRNGCILRSGGLVQLGSFLPDNNHVIANVNFTGAPAAPEPASIYTGSQIIIIKADNKTFSDGSPWKCLTCGIPEDNSRGRTDALDYPQSFRDGKKLLVGTNIIDCGDFDLASDGCTPERTYMYPIRWNTAVDGSGEGGALRELRLHPDGTHIGFNSFTVSSSGSLGQFAYVGRLEFNPSPITGLPLSPRYDITNITALFSDAPQYQPILVEGDKIRINPDEISVGEFRGFSSTGKEATYVGYPKESSNIDVFAVDLATGSVRRLTSHPEYCDPLDISSDDEWIVIMDTRGSDRQMFMAGMRHIPPVIDILTATASASTRNNGARRFFQPYLLDKYGDRGDYYGQQINGAGDGSAGSLNDPNWNGRLSLYRPPVKWL